MPETTPKNHYLMKVSMSLLFACILFLSVFSSMCPKFVPLVEVPLYLSILALGIFWIFKAKTKLSVLARFLLVATLGVIINMVTSYMVHQRVFPYEMYDDRTKEKMEKRKQEALKHLQTSIDQQAPKE
ncbi:MAG: hypothetical protein GQ531_11115 [Sulfurovum sp.]|nr:hypothetical protein [Sulfurovum sp.]